MQLRNTPSPELPQANSFPQSLGEATGPTGFAIRTTTMQTPLARRSGYASTPLGNQPVLRGRGEGVEALIPLRRQCTYLIHGYSNFKSAPAATLSLGTWLSEQRAEHFSI